MSPDEEQLRAVIEERVHAVRAKDPVPLAARQAGELLSYGVGTTTSGDEVSMWVRATLGCEKRDGTWLIVHDHESVPFDPESGQALIDLAP